MTELGAAVAAADVVLLETTASGPGEFISIAGARAAASVARYANSEVWLVAHKGRLLPKRIFEVIESRMASARDPWDADDEFVPVDLVTHIAGPTGVLDVAAGLTRCVGARNEAPASAAR